MLTELIPGLRIEPGLVTHFHLTEEVVSNRSGEHKITIPHLSIGVGGNTIKLSNKAAKDAYEKLCVCKDS
jgi:enolase